MDYYEMSRMDQNKEWYRKFKIIKADPEFSHLVTKHSQKKCKHYHWYYMFPGTNPMTLHNVMFTKSIMSLGSEEQVRKYMPLIDSW